MTAYEAVVNALSDTGITIRPNIVDAVTDEYCAYYCIYESPINFGDNQPDHIRCDIQVHYYAPRFTAEGRKNYNPTKKLIREKLFSYGFTYPQVQDLTEKEFIHLVFETEYAEER